jgi:hypothetical protein
MIIHTCNLSMGKIYYMWNRLKGKWALAPTTADQVIWHVKYVKYFKLKKRSKLKT